MRGTHKNPAQTQMGHQLVSNGHQYGREGRKLGSTSHQGKGATASSAVSLSLSLLSPKQGNTPLASFSNMPHSKGVGCWQMSPPLYKGGVIPYYGGGARSCETVVNHSVHLFIITCFKRETNAQQPWHKICKGLQCIIFSFCSQNNPIR